MINARDMAYKRAFVRDGKMGTSQKRSVIVNQNKQNMRRSGALQKPRDFYVDGPSAEEIKQSPVTSNVRVSDALYRKRNMNMGSNYYIPGATTSQDALWAIKPGDALWTSDHLSGTKKKREPFVFAGWNGIKHQGHTTNETMLNDYKFVGFAAEPITYTNKVLGRVNLTAETSVSRTIINTGEDILKAGDTVFYMLPHFNKNRSGASYELPNQDWVNKNKGSPNASRIVPQLRKFTPRYISAVNNQIFNTWMEYEDTLSNDSKRKFPVPLLPSSRFIKNTNTGHEDFTIDSYTTNMKLSVFDHITDHTSAVNFSQILINMGYLSLGPKLAGMNTADGIDEISGVVGLFESMRFKQNKNRKQIDKLNKSYLRQWLPRKYYTECNQKLKRATRHLMKYQGGNKNNETLNDILTMSSKIAELQKNTIFHNRTRNIVGKVSLGGSPGNPITIDARPGQIM